MERFIGLVCFLAFIILSVTAKDQNMTDGDVDVKVLGQSGKMTFGRKGNSLTVTFDYIKELDNSSAAVGTTGKYKHSINTFARENFTFTTSGLQSHYQNISVKHTQFNATISGPGARLIVDIYIFKGNGNVSTSGNETLEVRKGTIKFNIRLENWRFCGGNNTCRKGSTVEQGTQVELGIKISGKKAPNKKAKARGKGKKVGTFDFGDADCTLSGEVNVDGSWKEMVSDYPKLGQQNIFAFRFPKFDQYVLYDPTVELSSSVQPTNSTSTTMHSSYTSAISSNAPSTTMHSSYAPTNHTTANPSDSATNLQVGALPIMLAIYGVLKLLL